MYLAITKAITRYWGLKDNEPGVHALQCCGAAGAEQETTGEQWTEAEALAAGDFGRFLRLVNDSGISSAVQLQNIWSISSPKKQAITSLFSAI